MNRTLLAVALVAICLATPSASAHDQSLHKGKPTEGEIISVAPDYFVLKAVDGEKKVATSQITSIEIGDAKGSLSDLKSGARVAVFGTKLPGGRIVAKEIIVQRDGPHHENGGNHEAHE